MPAAAGPARRAARRRSADGTSLYMKYNFVMSVHYGVM